MRCIGLYMAGTNPPQMSALLKQPRHRIVTDEEREKLQVIRGEMQANYTLENHARIALEVT